MRSCGAIRFSDMIVSRAGLPKPPDVPLDIVISHRVLFWIIKLFLYL